MEQSLSADQLVTYFSTFSELLDLSRRTQPVTPEFSATDFSNYFMALKPQLDTHRAAGNDINVWHVSGLKRKEVPNSAVLAWWLDPLATHGLGSRVMEAFLDALGQKNAAEFKVALKDDSGNINYRVLVESLPLGEQDNRIDIEVEGPNILLFIEVKIDATEGKQQLERYQSLLKNKRKMSTQPDKLASGIVYLTVKPRALTDESVLPVLWSDLAHSFRAVDLPSESILARSLLNQFSDFIDHF